MPRGRPAAVGTETVNANGYCQVKTVDRGWVGKHTLVLEAKLGRVLLANERAVFKDGNKSNLDPSNIELSVTGNGSIQARIVKLRAEIADREALIQDLEQQLGTQHG